MSPFNRVILCIAAPIAGCLLLGIVQQLDVPAAAMPFGLVVAVVVMMLAAFDVFK